MKTQTLHIGSTLFALTSLAIFPLLFLQCQPASEQITVINNKPISSGKFSRTVNGSVRVKLEPHGSIRASIYKNQALLFEFILDREKQQSLLTQNIDNADVYLMAEHQDGLVIDDLQAHKRYVLSMDKILDKIQALPTSQPHTVTIKGYAVDLIAESNSSAFNTY